MSTTTPPRSWVLLVGILFALAGCNQGGPTIQAGPSASRSAPSGEPTGDPGAAPPDCAQLDAPVAVDGTLSEDPEIAAAQRARAENGLPSDEATVRAVLEQTDGDQYPMGFPHTQEEFDELNARNDLGRHAGAIRQWADREASGAFAGMWLDHRAGGVFTVAFTHDLERFRRSIHERFDPTIKVVAAEHPMSELRALQEKVSRWMGDRLQEEQHDDGPEPGGIVSVGIRDPENRVRIGVFEPDEADRRKFAQQWGADRICLEPIDIPEAEDAQPAGWVPAPDADLSARSTRIDVLVNEFACAGGQSAEGRIVPPTVNYQTDAVIIAIEVIPKAGPNTCPGNPDTPYTVELAEPLGDRQLLDGRTDPPSDPSLEFNPETDATQ